MEPRNARFYVVFELDTAKKDFNIQSEWEKRMCSYPDDDKNLHFFVDILIGTPSPVLVITNQLSTKSNPRGENLAARFWNDFPRRRHVAEFSVDVEQLYKKYHETKKYMHRLFSQGKNPDVTLETIKNELNRNLVAVHFDGYDDKNWVRYSSIDMTVAARAKRRLKEERVIACNNLCNIM